MGDEPDTKRVKRDDIREYYQIELRSERKSRKFKTKSQVYDVSFRPFNQPFDFTRELFSDLMTQLYEVGHVQPRDQVRLSILHPDLDFGIHIPFEHADQLTGHRVLDEIEKVAQSNQAFRIHDGDTHLELTHITMPEGSGRKSFQKTFSPSGMVKGKTSMVQIHNSEDCMCLARAIVVGLCKTKQEQTPEWKQQWRAIRDPKISLQKNEAMELLRQVNIRPDQPCGVEEYNKIQGHLYPEYVIKIHAQNLGSELLFKPPRMAQGSRALHVYYSDNHYDCITSITGFLGKSYYCEYCDVACTDRGSHKCRYVCECYANVLCQAETPVSCQTCHRVFRSQSCYDKHMATTGKQKKSICQLVHNCQKCGQLIVMSKRNHTCPGTKKCRYCKEIVGSDHECYIPVYETPEIKPVRVPFIFFDFECRFDSGIHIPNFCVAQRACERCICQPATTPCHCFTMREFVFRGENTLSEFCDWLFQPIHKGATVIAHNAQGYDGQFVLRHIITKSTSKPELIMNGSKIIMLKAYGIRLIDSLSFLSMPLSAFPKTFGLTEMAKGWFPFYANTLANQDYVGPYFPMECYKPNSMKPAQREAFLTWYHEQAGKVFHFQHEMEKYCKSDVDLLRRGCGEFRQQLLDSDGIDPFREATTLAQVCNKAWRKNSMPPQSLGIISDAGYPNKVRYSMKGVRWLQMIAFSHGIHIRHALNNRGEVKIGPYYVDGYCKENNTVYEFLGCWFHGCPHCFKSTTVNAYNLKSMQELYDTTQTRLQWLQSQGYLVETQWECEFDKTCLVDPVYRRRAQLLYYGQDPITPREALFGGRTNAVKLYHEVSGDQEIKYADICSLYPFVNKYREYPIGHPKILSQEQIGPVEQYRGLIKCQVLPPQDLWMPVLPIHCNKKMVFTLCRTCAEQELAQCTHSVHDRALYGTWTSVELAKALDMGYKVLRVYHVWHWDQWSDQVYRQYIDKYLKIKQEASGYPEWVTTESDQQKFKQDYFEAEGIVLDHIEKNPGKRAFAKTMLNCLWGKNAQNNMLPKTEYVKSISRYYEILADPKKSVKYVDMFDHDQFMLMNYTDESGQEEPHSSSNAAVASFVTAYARLELYKVLERLGDRVLYFDTDSCIYIHDPQGYNIPIESSRLGKWTDEVPQGRIVKYVSLGPKSYGYEYIENGKRQQTCKVKGITLDYNTSQLVNFDAMEECVNDRQNYVKVIEYESRIRRHRDRKVCSEKQIKTFRSVYTKRVVVNQYFTVPYGYQWK